MVHLSGTYAQAYGAGLVHGYKPVVLEVDTALCADMGHRIGRATPAVYLVDEVPPDCIEPAEEPDGFDPEDVE